MGLALMLGAPQAAGAAEQSGGTALLASGSGYAVAGGSPRVEALQRRLEGLGERPGPVDGLFGPRTEEAVRRLQERSGLAADGIVGPATRRALDAAPPRTLTPGAGYGAPGGWAQVMTLQRRLRAAGERVGPIDGVYGPRTEAAVRRLQAKGRLAVDGVAGPQTYAALDRVRRDGTRQAGDEPDAERRGSDRDERQASAGRPEQEPGEGRERPEPAERPAAGPPPRTAQGDGGNGFPWAVLAAVVAVLGVALALFLGRGSLPRRKPATSVIPLGRGLALEGESSDPAIGRFSGTAYAVEIPELKDAERRAENSRFFVLDPGRKLPFWVSYAEVETPLPAALQAHPGPWVGQRGLRAGSPVLGYVTVPRSVPERQAELYDQLARIEALCKRRKFSLLGVIRDVEGSGDVLERPGMHYALEQLDAREASGLVVCDIERVGESRAQIDALLARLDETGVALVALAPELDTSTAEGRELVRQLEIVRGERAKLVERRAPQRSREDDVRERILAMRDRGESLQAIADALNGEQVPPPRGRPKWRPASVRATLERDRPGADRNVVELRPPGRFQRGGPESPAEAEPRPPDGDPKTRQGRRKS